MFASCGTRSWSFVYVCIWTMWLVCVMWCLTWKQNSDKSRPVSWYLNIPICVIHSSIRILAVANIRILFVVYEMPPIQHTFSFLKLLKSSNIKEDRAKLLKRLCNIQILSFLNDQIFEYYPKTPKLTGLAKRSFHWYV